MFKTLKDAKRRVVESVLEGVGASEKTVDEEFNTYHAKYLTMMQDLNECGAGFHSILNLQKQFFNDALEFSNTVSRIHQTYGNPEYWQGAESELASVNGGTEYQAKMELIHNVYRSSCALIAVERALDPLREAIAKITPEIDSMVKERNTQLIDYDSYRRRLKALREKAETLEQNGKGGTTQAQENLQEIAKFENKEKLAKEGYEDKNTRTKQEIIRARQQSDHLMNDVLVASVVAQQELFAGAARELEKVIELLPQNKVDEVRNKIHTVVKQGGAYVPPKEEKTGLQKGLAIISGKNVPSDFKKEKEPGDAPPAPTTAAPAAAPASSSNSGGGLSKAFSFGGSKAKSSSASAPPPPSAPNPFAAGGNPFSVDESPPPPPSSTATARSNTAVPPPPPTSAVPPPPTSAVPPPPAAVAPSPPAAKPKVMVEALYDHEAEAEDELNFRAGEMVEVIETSDDGWWKGKCRGQVGLFPVNYVKTLN